MSESKGSPRVLEKVKPLDYDIDQEGNLAYWDIVEGKYRVLEPGKSIEDPNCVIGKVGQQNLLPGHFTLKNKDLENTQLYGADGEKLGEPISPGLSVFLYFGTQQSGQDSLSSTSTNSTGKEPTKKNRLYFSQIRDIQNAGWAAIYAPLANPKTPPLNPLHVLLVPNSIQESGKIADAQEAEKTALVDAFVRWAPKAE